MGVHITHQNDVAVEGDQIADKTQLLILSLAAERQMHHHHQQRFALTELNDNGTASGQARQAVRVDLVWREATDDAVAVLGHRAQVCG